MYDWGRVLSSQFHHRTASWNNIAFWNLKFYFSLKKNFYVMHNTDFLKLPKHLLSMNWEWRSLKINFNNNNNAFLNRKSLFCSFSIGIFFVGHNKDFWSVLCPLRVDMKMLWRRFLTVHRICKWMLLLRLDNIHWNYLLPRSTRIKVINKKLESNLNLDLLLLTVVPRTNSFPL